MYKWVLKDPSSHGADKNHISLLNSDTFRIYSSEVGQYNNLYQYNLKKQLFMLWDEGKECI